MRKAEKKVFWYSSLVALAALLLCTTAQAQANDGEFTATLTAINDSILLDGQALFDITITNPNNYAERYRISMPDIEWSVQSDPLYEYFSGIDVPALGSKTVRLLLKPTVSFPPSLRNVNFVLTATKSKQSQTLSTFVNIRSNSQLLQEYLAAVSRIVEIPAQIDPRSEFTIKVNLINRNPKNISNLRIALSSVTSSIIRQEITTNLNPLESKAVTATVKLDATTPPAKDTLKVVLYVNDQPLEPTIFEKFEVVSYSDITPLHSTVKKSFLKVTNETVYVNDGNVRSQKVIETPQGLLKSLFTRTNPKSYSISKGGDRYTAWEIALDPQEQTTITVTESYRSILYLIILAAVSLILYRFFQSPVKIIKESTAISYKEGGISELKVVLRIKNTSNQPYIKITAMDRVPMIAELEHDSMGTLKPATTFNDGKGSVIKWELENLDKHEERILAYKIRSKLSILGTFVLPKATLRFYTEKNVKFVTHSNTVTIKP